MNRRAATAAVAGAILMTVGADRAKGQWPSDPAANLALADGASDQNQPKLVLGRGGSAGSAYLSWFDGIGTGWDVRLQRITEAGSLVYPPGGVLVADRDFSSTQDYGLDVDPDGNAWLAFRLDSATSQIAVQKVAPDGTPLLNSGMPLVVATGAGSRNQPGIAATSDGNAVVAFANNNDVRLIGISGADGSTMWTMDETAGVNSRNTPSDIRAADGGSVIVSYIHGGTAFGSPTALWANKYTADGMARWGSPVIVYDLSSLPFGNFPKFVHDGAGGGVFGWYGANNDAFVQHITSNAMERFGHNGVIVSTHASDLQVNTTVLYDAANDQIYLFWLERNGTQTQWGVYGQRVDGATATRQWGDEGLAVVPLDGTERSFVTAVAAPCEGAIVAWFEGGFGSKVVRAARVDGEGQLLWGPVDVSTNPSDKGRLAATITSSGMTIAAWSDQRNDGGDIYGQNVYADGTLGPIVAGCPCEYDGDAGVDVFDLLAYLDIWFAGHPDADIDGAPCVDVFDLLAFLDCWFPASAGVPCP